MQNTLAGDYAAYGMRLRSALPLPFPPATPVGGVDVEVVFGKTPAALPAPWRARHFPWQAVPGAFLFTAPKVARYLATGARVLVERCGGSDAAIAGFFAKQVLSAVLQQRCATTLHASAVADEWGAMVFLGASGSGKSTLLAAMMKRGYSAVADDVLGVTLADGMPVALPGLPEVRLTPDSCRALGLSSGAMPRVLATSEKRRLPPDRPVARATPIRAFYILDEGADDGVEIRPETPAADRELLTTHRYRGHYGQWLGTAAVQRRKLQAAAAAAGTFRVLRPGTWPLDVAIDALAARVEAHWMGATSRTSRNRPGSSSRSPEATGQAER